ncbi:MAG: hypothetical protein U0Q16_16435 [Bryobacteraceae bacterium]
MRSSVAVIAGVAGAALGAGSVWFRYQGLERDLAAGRQSIAALEERARGLERERDSLRQAQGAVAPAVVRERTPEHPRAAAAKVSADDPVTRQELIRMLNEKNDKLAAADDAVREVRAKLQETEARTAELTQGHGKLTEAEADLKERLSASMRLTEALQLEVKQRNERLAQLEVANQDLRKRSEDSTRKVVKSAQLTGEMRDLALRQEAYLDNILRRYREATDQFRTLAVRLENPRDGAVPVGAGSDLSRIQQTIAMAEDDLRQLRSLNSQARKLEREMAAAR